MMIFRGLVICMLIGAGAPDGWSQGYPARLVRLIVPGTGGTEIVGRLVAQGMSQVLGQQVIVDVRAGAGTNIGAEIAAKAPPDGYTLFQVLQSHAVNVSLYRKLSYDLERDFVAVTQTDSSPLIIVVHPSLPVRSVSDLVKLAKAKPGAIDYSSGGVGTSTYLGGELFKSTAGINFVQVAYRGGDPAMTAVVAGEVSVYFAPVATVLQFVEQGRLRALAVTSLQRLPLVPKLPTVAESGYPGFETGNWHGIMVPAKTPNEIIALVRKAALAAVNQPDVSSRMRDLGYISHEDTPEQFAAFIKSEIEKWRKVVRSNNLSEG